MTDETEAERIAAQQRIISRYSHEARNRRTVSKAVLHKQQQHTEAGSAIVDKPEQQIITPQLAEQLISKHAHKPLTKEQHKRQEALRNLELQYNNRKHAGTPSTTTVSEA